MPNKAACSQMIDVERDHIFTILISRKIQIDWERKCRLELNLGKAFTTTPAHNLFTISFRRFVEIRCLLWATKRGRDGGNVPNS